MKLRLRPNSVRLRLTRSEVETLTQTGAVSEMISFGPDPENQLMYAVETHDADGLGFHYQGGSMVVYLPTPEVADWAESDRVGFTEVIDLGTGETLTLIVEKDFKCLTDRPGEDESDAYPHPEESHGHVC